jgi:serine/threonine protein kinase/tetratricopeptide (TPR) repeat protein
MRNKITIGKTISHYNILEKIGEGGMGVVYRAGDTKLKREVALKFLPKELTKVEEAKQRFIQEAQAAAALDHPNICTVYEIDEIEGQTFISMACIKGQSLKEKMAKGPLDIANASDIASQVATGLKEAHKKGIIHRDIKPANIMITEDGQAKIMDFGLAKLEWGVDLTKTATVMGTVAYMSPEQAKGEEVDQRTDIWSWGAMMYEMLTGILPFKSHPFQAALYSIIHDNPKPIKSMREEVPKGLARIVEKCLEKDPRKRYENMNALMVDLRSIGSQAISTDTDKPSIAVLPFVNMSADPENEYFSDGLAEDLINALTKIKDLHVVARTSSFAFKGEKADIREIGQKLNVENLLEGSVRKVGNRVRITAQLIKVADGYHLWSERYDRHMEDVFAIQDEITENIMSELMMALDVHGEPAGEHRPANLEAYDLYLKGRYHLNRFAIDKAFSYYKKSIDEDPGYAPAFAAVAEAYTLLSVGFDILPGKDTMPQAREAAQKALELDPDMAEAYVSLGLVSTFYDWNRKDTKRYFRKALELNPNAAAAHQWYEFLWTYMEADFDKARSHLERAQELDPLNIMIKLRMGYVFLFAGDLDRAERQFKEIVDLEPGYSPGHLSLMNVYGVKGRYEEALRAGEKALAISPPFVAYTGGLGHLYAVAGKKEKAYQFLTDLQERSARGYVSSFWVAAIYLGLSDFDSTFEWLEKAYRERDSNLIYVTVVPFFDPVRSDPRYKQLLIKMGLENLVPRYTR